MISAAERWVADQERLAKPARVYWCDGSDGEAWRLLEIGLNEERLNGPVFQELNHAAWPTAYLHRSSTTDVARVEHLTFVCHPTKEAAGPNNNWMEPDKAKKLMTNLSNDLDFSGMPYPAMPLEARVALILAKYAGFGTVPVVIPSVLVDVPMPTDRIPAQRGKDLAYIRHLAEEAGYVFYVEPGPAPGTSLAYWGPELKVGVPQRALNVDLDAHRNVKSISFRYDAESARLPVVYVQEPSTRAPIPIPIPDVSLLNPPLGLVPPIPKQVEPLEGTARA